MRIAVNTRFLLPNKMEGFGWYTFETISRIVRNHPEHEFFFFFDRKYDEKFIFADNVTPVVLNPPARHPILFKIWFNYSVTKALKKFKCDAFISPDGYLSLKTTVPQLAVIHDLNFEHNPEDLPKSALKYLQKNFPLFAKKAKAICTVSEFSKQDIVEKYCVNESKITVSYNGANEIFKPLSLEEKTATKKRYSNGEEFILFVGALSPRKNIKRLIEAYTKLKLEHHISEKLVIVGENLWSSISLEIPEEIKSDILLTGHLTQQELARVTASAKVFAFVPYFEGFGIPLLEAMQCGVPCLAGNLTSLPEVGGDAVQYCNPLQIESIAKNLQILLENKTLREEFSLKSVNRAKEFSWNKTAEGLWNCFEKMMK